MQSCKIKRIKQRKEKMQKPKQIHCKNCSSASIVKRGFAKNKLQALQKYQCKSCKAIFTAEQAKGKTYPISTILSAISIYNLGHSLEKTAEIINKKHILAISAKTISNWIKEHKEICTYARLRKQAIKLFSPKDIIFQ
jgi:transposase-like protein